MFSFAEIAAATAGSVVRGDPQARVNGVSTDSRTIIAGSLFVALRGERFDGHDFAATACLRTGIGIMVEQRWLQQATPPANAAAIIAVEDTLRALQQLAGFYRQRCRLPVVCVTGSNGKSTTKELIAALLATRRRVLKSQESFNNHIGVPLSILAIRPEHEAAVLELGMNHAGEIRRLAQIARPDVAVITTVAEAHLGFFDSLDEIAAAKCEILEQMQPDQVAVINADVPALAAASEKYSVRRVTFGVEQPAMITATDIRATAAGVSFRVDAMQQLQLPLLGRHNVSNALAAIAVARHFGVTDAQIQGAFAAMKPLGMRLEQRMLNGVRLLVDCYNANPGSLRAAIEVLAEQQIPGRRILTLGDMKELGKHSPRAHEMIGMLAARRGIEMLVTVGAEAAASGRAARIAGMNPKQIHACNSAEEAGRVLARFTRPGDVVLLKGSRSMHLEETIRILSDDTGAGPVPE